MSLERILIVDDNPDNLDLARILLEAKGWEMRAAEDALQALEILRTYHPHLVLMDVQLPGMDGLELTRKLRSQPAFEDVMIVALTAYAMRADEESARAAGCDGYITKPIDTRSFADVVSGYLQTPRPLRPAQAEELPSAADAAPGAGDDALHQSQTDAGASVLFGAVLDQ